MSDSSTMKGGPSEGLPMVSAEAVSSPGHVRADILVIGGGLAGLFAALCAAESVKVTLVTEGALLASNSYWAQGGVAAAIDEADTPLLHAADTLRVGGGLNSADAVRVLSEEGPARIADLLRFGVHFDGGPDGPHLGLEGGHSRRRILHAAGSATGSRIVGVLAAVVRQHPNITVHETTVAEALLSDGDRCGGALLRDVSTGRTTIVAAPSTVLATGGASALYTRTTNPLAARGSGVALAMAAGAALADMEFIQFHPTALAAPDQRSFLLSEALRGEGAYLLDARGRRFMVGRHELAELAPRDVVARAVVEEMRKAGDDHVYLSLRHLEAAPLRARFANIDEYLREQGLDLTSDLLPIAPAAHYTMGGIATDTWGASTLPGLFACGEVACTGVHGANRLASNSLLECLVFGERAARAAAAYGPTAEPVTPRSDGRVVVPAGDLPADDLARLRTAMMVGAGLVRDDEGLAHLQGVLHDLSSTAADTLQPAVTVASTIALAARTRTESRGAHLRSDYPEENPLWAAHIILQNDEARIERALPAPAWMPRPVLDEAMAAVVAAGVHATLRGIEGARDVA